MTIHFVTQLYSCNDESAWKRQLQCLKKNLMLSSIVSATIFLDGVEAPWISSKVNWEPITGRLSYGDFLSLFLRPTSRSGAKHLLLSNSDIIFDDTLDDAVRCLQAEHQVFCLSRHERNAGITDVNEPMRSQDSWLFLRHQPSGFLIDALRKIQLGVAGCENILAANLWAYGYELWNPCLDWCARHQDPYPSRYAPDGDRYWGLYAYVPPCRLNDVLTRRPEVAFQHAQAPGFYQWLDVDD